MRRIRACEEIRQRQMVGVPSEDYVYNLYLDATGNEDEAHRATTRYLLSLIRSGHLTE